MQTYRVTLAYEGSDFVGWQRQSAGESVQGLVEASLVDLAGGSEVTVTGAGRTDAGVHALGQVASFTLARDIAPESLLKAMNAHLPASIRVVAAARVPLTFHARFDARSKVYRYRIWNGEIVSPFERRHVWHLVGDLDVEAMVLASRVLPGKHDFAAFRAAGTLTRTTERVMSRVTVQQAEVAGPPAGRLITIEVAGDGFLRHMVRNIVGSLVEVGRKRQPPEWIEKVMAGRDRTMAGPTAPAEGLWMVSVSYDSAATAALAAER